MFIKKHVQSGIKSAYIKKPKYLVYEEFWLCSNFTTYSNHVFQKPHLWHTFRVI